MREYVRALIALANSLNSAAATSRDAGGMRSALLSRAAGAVGGGVAAVADAAGVGVDAAGREAPSLLESTRLVVRRTESVRGGGTIGTDGERKLREDTSKNYTRYSRAGDRILQNFVQYLRAY